MITLPVLEPETNEKIVAVLPLCSFSAPLLPLPLCPSTLQAKTNPCLECPVASGPCQFSYLHHRALGARFVLQGQVLMACVHSVHCLSREHRCRPPRRGEDLETLPPQSTRKAQEHTAQERDPHQITRAWSQSCAVF